MTEEMKTVINCWQNPVFTMPEKVSNVVLLTQPFSIVIKVDNVQLVYSVAALAIDKVGPGPTVFVQPDLVPYHSAPANQKGSNHIEFSVTYIYY